MKDTPRYQGKLTLTTPATAIRSTKCATCKGQTINGEQWCYRCKDPEGYTEHLRLAHEQARQRTLEAYPFCKKCGERLSPEIVQQGRNVHTKEERCRRY